MEILPTSTLAEITEFLQQTLINNIVIIIGVIGLAVGIAFVTRWFNKATVIDDGDSDEEKQKRINKAISRMKF